MQEKQGDERAAGRHRQILDAAVRAFAEKGFFKTRVADIARYAGVAAGTIYLYFKSKDDILISLFEVRMEENLRDLASALESYGAPVEKLKAFVRLYLSMVDRDPLLAEVITVELRQSGKFMRDYENPAFHKLLKFLTSILEEGQSAGSFRVGLHPKIIARAIFGALDEITLWAVLSQRKISLDEAAETLGNLWLDGLRTRV
jgi:TetR/AcrR family fatty acid metabolism transcriptional regulator